MSEEKPSSLSLACPCGEMIESKELLELHLIEVHYINGDFAPILTNHIAQNQKPSGTEAPNEIVIRGKQISLEEADKILEAHRPKEPEPTVPISKIKAKIAELEEKVAKHPECFECDYMISALKAIIPKDENKQGEK